MHIHLAVQKVALFVMLSNFTGFLRILILIRSCASFEYYIGGLLPPTDEKFEYDALMRMAISLVNNHSDGFFDEDLQDVTLIMMINETTYGPDSNAGSVVAAQVNFTDFCVLFFFPVRATMNKCCWSYKQLKVIKSLFTSQVAWAQRHSKELVGVIGSYYSSASLRVAEFGNIYVLPQISQASSAESLTNFAYFSRVCASNSIISSRLAYFVKEILGLKALTLIYQSDDLYTQSMASTFQNVYLTFGSDYKIIFTYVYKRGELNVPKAIESIELAGTPGVNYLYSRCMS